MIQSPSPPIGRRSVRSSANRCGWNRCTELALSMPPDCLPVLFCDESGSLVAAAHAGWRGLLAGVLEETIRAMDVPGRNLMAYLGPAIGPQAFEVGDEVRSAYVAASAKAAAAFKPSRSGKW